VALAPLRRLARTVADDGGSVPPFDEFWAAGFLEVPGVDDDLVLFTIPAQFLIPGIRRC